MNAPIKKPVDEQVVLTTADGDALYLNIQSRTIGAPLVLFLHGGPGGFLNPPIFQTYSGRHLEVDHTVVYYYQRRVFTLQDVPYALEWPPGTGQGGYTVEHHIDDVDQVIEYLCERFGQRQLVLVGHSWGGLLGFAYLSKYQAKRRTAAYVAVAPSINAIRNQQVVYRMLLEEAERQGQAEIVDWLQAKGEPPYDADADIFVMMGHCQTVFGGQLQNVSFEEIYAHTEYSQLDQDVCVKRRHRLSGLLWPELRRLDLTERLRPLDVPLLMLAGGRDYFVPVAALEEGFAAYGTQCPGVEKRFELLPEAMHVLMTDAPERFRHLLEEFLRSHCRS